MASRFGGVSSSQSYATKMRWLVGGLAFIISVLLVVVVVIYQNTSASTSGTDSGAVTDVPPDAAPAPNAQTGAADVVFAATRIEEGDPIQEAMFTSQPMDETRVPLGAIRRKDLPTLQGKFAARLISPNTPVTTEDISDRPPISALKIPSGYRAVTITVDARQGVEGFAKPNTRVDVLWTFSQDGKQKVATIVRFTKILSVGGNTGTEGNKAEVGAGATVTLLVTEKDAKKIELARTLGTLSLTLVGGDENIGPKVDDPDAITIADLVGGPQNSGQPEEVSSDGVMYTMDPVSGRQIRYVLKGGRWTQDRNY